MAGQCRAKLLMLALAFASQSMAGGSADVEDVNPRQLLHENLRTASLKGDQVERILATSLADLVRVNDVLFRVVEFPFGGSSYSKNDIDKEELYEADWDDSETIENRALSSKSARLPTFKSSKSSPSVKSTKAPTLKSSKSSSIKSTKAPSVKSTKAPSMKSTKAPSLKSSSSKSSRRLFGYNDEEDATTFLNQFESEGDQI